MPLSFSRGDRTSGFVLIPLLPLPKLSDFPGQLLLSFGRDAKGSSGVRGDKPSIPWNSGITQRELVPHHLPHICLLQQRIHFSCSCWGLINASGSCDPVINSFAHNCCTAKPWIRRFSPSPPLGGLNSQKKKFIFLPIFLPFLAFFFFFPTG